MISTHGRSSFPLNYQHIQHIIIDTCNVYAPLFVWALTFGTSEGFELTTLCAHSKSSYHVSCHAHTVLTLFFKVWLATFGQVTSKKSLLDSQWTWHLRDRAFRPPKKSPMTPKAMLLSTAPCSCPDGDVCVAGRMCVCWLSATSVHTPVTRLSWLDWALVCSVSHNLFPPWKDEFLHLSAFFNYNLAWAAII